MVSRRDRASAFTLIELLVVVAIIALLISILLPSLSKARAQARSTLCATRIGQLTKAMIIYADDYSETPPFVGVGFEDIDEMAEEYNHLGSPPKHTAGYFARHESWLIPGHWWVDEQAWLASRGQWNQLIANGLRIEDGTLFDYTRFDELYRCPEFERIKDSTKTQDLFNYTRTVMGRKVYSQFVNDPQANGEDFQPGHIMKISAVYAPASMIMMLDEQWDFHCAGNYLDGGSFGMSGAWMAGDPIHGLAWDMLGSYHGTEGTVIANPPIEIQPSQMGNMGYYDGHVALQRDPWPWRTGEIDLATLGAWAQDENNIKDAMKIVGLLIESIYAQRGIGITMDMLIQLLM